jgi:23S rRNA-/tRNA-specific pseudouridylate synthase
MKWDRTHQIRLHAQHHGLPIVGDDVYGRERGCYSSIDEVRACSFDRESAHYADGNALRAGLKLHAWRMSLTDPRDAGSVLTFTAPPPRTFVDFAEQQGVLPEEGILV